MRLSVTSGIVAGLIILVVYVIFKANSGSKTNVTDKLESKISNLFNVMFQRSLVTQNPVTISPPSSQNSSTMALIGKILCKKDKDRIQKLLRDKDPNSNEPDDTRFFRLISDPIQTGCDNLKKIGGSWNGGCNSWDGEKFVCMDDIIRSTKANKCLIYSFGISADWTFEDYSSKWGCRVHAYDHTINQKDYDRSKLIRFHNLGISHHDNDPKLKTLKTLLKMNGDTDKEITYLKMDIEGAEKVGMMKWIEDGSLKNVKQIAMEWHVETDVPKFKQILQKMIGLGYKLISHQPNNCWVQLNKNKYMRLFEIVFRKTDFIGCDKH